MQALDALRQQEDLLRHLLGLVVRVSLELQSKLRAMFLPTAQRCHYIFTMRDISVIFRYQSFVVFLACYYDKSLLYEMNRLWM